VSGTAAYVAPPEGRTREATPLVPVHVETPERGLVWSVRCEVCGPLAPPSWSEATARKTAADHQHCPCPDVGGTEVGAYIVDLCHSRGVHDDTVIWPLVNAAREEALALCEQVVNEALGPQEKAEEHAHASR
jgi:hypothetical protein